MFKVGDRVITSKGEIGVVTDVSGIVEAVMPSVVSITSTSSIEGYSVFGQKVKKNGKIRSFSVSIKSTRWIRHRKTKVYFVKSFSSALER